MSSTKNANTHTQRKEKKPNNSEGKKQRPSRNKLCKQGKKKTTKTITRTHANEHALTLDTSTIRKKKKKKKRETGRQVGKGWGNTQ